MTREERYAAQDKMMADIFAIGAETVKVQAQARWVMNLTAVLMGGIFFGVVLLLGWRFIHGS